MNSGLLATKLHRPATPPGCVPRPHLLQRLDEGLASGRQIILVSAPAGFGKTTCIGEWLDDLDRWPVAWLSLDAADNDPRRFFAYFLAALQRVDAALGREIEGALHAGQLPPAEVIGATLINDVFRTLGAEGRFVLVLDDLHTIQEPTILQVLEKLVANLPPAMHLALLTREDPPLPMARLRAHGRLTEIRAADLRFRGPEAEQFLNHVLGLSLAPAQVALLKEKTEGWIAGLQLAGLSVRDRADRAEFLTTLSGSHRFILSYLTEEVLSQQPEEIRRFLVQTAILNRLNGDLCDAVTGRSDGRTMLERLFHANLFLIPLDDERRWYRYHSLFADLLRDIQDTLPAEELSGLHRRAGHWYASAADEPEGFVAEAMHHTLAGQDYELAIALLERHASGLIMQGYARTVNGWVEAMSAEWTSSSPRTSLALAWMHLLRGSYADAAPHLERARDAFQSARAEPHLRAEASSLEAEWLTMQCLYLVMQGKAMEGRSLAARALEMAAGQDNRLQGLAHFGLAYAYEILEDHEAVVETYQRAIQHSRAAGDLVIEMLSTAALARLALEQGRLHLAFEIATPVSARLDEGRALPPISTVVFGILGEVCYQWHQIEEAQHHAWRALQLSTMGGYNSGLINLRTLLSRLSQLDGDLEGAAREIQQAVDLIKVDTPDYVRQESISQQVRVYLARNHPAAAEMVLQGQGFSFRDRFSFPALTPERIISHSLGLLYNSSLHLLVQKARAGGDLNDLTTGIELADAVIADALRGGRGLVALEALLLRAQMHSLLGKGKIKAGAPRASHLKACQTDYVRALRLGEPEGIIGSFVEHGPPVAKALADLAEQEQIGGVAPDYVGRLLVAFARTQGPGSTRGPQAAKPPARSEGVAPIDAGGLVEPLTDREMDVLRLMTRGLKYREIAAELFISLNTVRSHVKAIYGKLLVNNRTRAVEKARRLGML